MNKDDVIALGYDSPKEINGVWCGIARFAYMTGLVVGINRLSYQYRYCYHKYIEACSSLNHYEDTNEHPIGNWIKRKGLESDLSNPNYITNNHDDIN